MDSNLALAQVFSLAAAGDQVVLDTLKGGKMPELGFAGEDGDDDDDDDVEIGEVTEGNLVEYLGSLSEDMDVGATDPMARVRARSRLRRINLLAANNQKVARILGPTLKLLQSTKSMLSRAAASAAHYRVTQTMEQLSGPNHKTNVHIEGLATAGGSALVTITAPYSGQPFRLIDLNTEVRSVATAAVPATEVCACGFGSFIINGIERVQNNNVAIASGSVGTAKWDFSDFSARNPTHPRRKVYPWGTGPTTWLSPDAKIQFTVRNDSGSTVNASISLLWQASPCTSRDPSIITKDLVDPSEHADLFRQFLKFRPFRPGR